MRNFLFRYLGEREAQHRHVLVFLEEQQSAAARVGGQEDISLKAPLQDRGAKGESSG